MAMITNNPLPSGTTQVPSILKSSTSSQATTAWDPPCLPTLHSRNRRVRLPVVPPPFTGTRLEMSVTLKPVSTLFDIFKI